MNVHPLFFSACLLLILVPPITAPAHAAPAAPASAQNGARLFAEMGCNRCHAGVSSPTNELRERIPDLGGAGLRYQPGYLFEFLQNPLPVRQHLQHARMPSFHLTPKEALALVEFLQTQRTPTASSPPFPSEILDLMNTEPVPVPRTEFEAELTGGLICLTCHTLNGAGGRQAVELTSVGHRLNPDWIKRYLVAPDVFGIAPALMPPQFYKRSDDEQRFQPLTPRASEQIRIVSGYLGSLNPGLRRRQEQSLLAAKAAHPDADAALGKKLFISLNCAACHRHPTIPSRPNAPSLVSEGIRVKRSWLLDYLKHPSAIRPFGVHPGDGARMPDFRLSVDEASDLTAFLHAQKDPIEALPHFSHRPLSAFSAHKARLLLHHKLSCLGCHRLGSQGGRIGPDLTAAGLRLQPDYLFGMISNPRGIAPHTIMPLVPMPPATLELIASFLMDNQEPHPSLPYLSVADYPLSPTLQGDSTTNTTQLYLASCAPCHGPRGQGDGFNAGYLPVPPSRHALAAHTAAIPDDTLHDGIHAGGAILNKSPRMPPWGSTLTPDQIKSLVRHIRDLCQCQGPAWSQPVRP